MGQAAGYMHQARFTKYAKDKKIKDGKNEHAPMRHRPGTDIFIALVNRKITKCLRLRVSPYSGHLREKLSLWTPKRHVGERNRSIRPIILNLGTRWRTVVRFTPRPLYPRSKSSCCPFAMKLVGAQRGSAAFEKRKIPTPTANHTTSVHS